MATAADLDRATDSTWEWVAQQTRTYLASGGTHGHESDGVRLLILATTGRTSGQPRRTCLITDPDWCKNLQANPSVGVQAATRRFTGRARLACPAERDALWPQMVRIFPLYEQYPHKTDRQIPVVLPTPQD